MLHQLPTFQEFFSELTKKHALKTTLALEDINSDLKEVKTEDDIENANLKVLHTLIHYKLIDQRDVQKLIDDKKIVFKNNVEVGG